MQILSYRIPSKYISRLQCIQNTLTRVVGGSRTPNRTSNLATLSQLHWLPIHDRIKFKIATMTHKAIPVTPNIWLIWSSGTLHPEIYGLPLPTFSLSFVATSHLVLEVFAQQLLLFGIVCPLTSILVKWNSHNIPPTPEISSFPFSLCHCPVTHLSASDSFTTMALHQFTYYVVKFENPEKCYWFWQQPQQNVDIDMLLGHFEHLI